MTAYDACYLLLTKDRGLPIATLDRRWAEAAASNDVPLVLYGLMTRIRMLGVSDGT